jgi:O-acetyl-ADP-ribose deacetylase (regulator of RNase III)
LGDKVALYCGNITRFEIDAIVNSASRELDGDYGVDRAIHVAAGDDLVRESILLAPCEIGDAKITGGYKLPAKYVIHTVGPLGEHPTALAKCYRQCMDVLVANKLRTIAFPCIATGLRRYPAKAAAQVAVGEIKAWLATGENAQLVDLIIFCVNGQATAYFYRNALLDNF